MWPVRLVAPDWTRAGSLALTGMELSRANGFRSEHLRRRYVLTHAVLRSLLSRYLARPASAIRFEYGAAGKPSLAPPDDNPRFNLSHSGDLSVYAFASGFEVGIDLETIRRIPEADAIARHFTPEEYSELESLHGAERRRAFVAAWTRKEAYVKAQGGGLRIPLNGFRVSLLPAEPVALLEVGGRTAGGWVMHSFEPFAGTIAALATRGQR